MATALYQINPYRTWHWCWEMTDLWASGITVLECIYLLLFLVILPHLLSIYKFILSLVFLHATPKYFFLSIISQVCHFPAEADKSTLILSPLCHTIHLPGSSYSPFMDWEESFGLLLAVASAFVTWLHFAICCILDRNMDSVYFTTFNHKWNFIMHEPGNFT